MRSSSRVPPVQLGDKQNEHSSMLIHVTRFNSVQTGGP